MSLAGGLREVFAYPPPVTEQRRKLGLCLTLESEPNRRGGDCRLPVLHELIEHMAPLIESAVYTPLLTDTM